MKRITSKEFQQDIEVYSDAALSEPVVIADNDGDRLVLLSIEDYERLASQNIRINNDDDEDIDEETEKLIDESIERHRQTLEKLAAR